MWREKDGKRVTKAGINLQLQLTLKKSVVIINMKKVILKKVHYRKHSRATKARYHCSSRISDFKRESERERCMRREKR